MQSIVGPSPTNSGPGYMSNFFKFGTDEVDWYVKQTEVYSCTV